MCGPGRYQDGEGKDTCDYCPTKTYQEDTGQYECKGCPVDFLGSLEGSPMGQKDCGEKCPVGSICSLKQLSTNLPWVQTSPTVFELSAYDTFFSPKNAEYTLKIDGWTSTGGGNVSPDFKDIQCIWRQMFYEYRCTSWSQKLPCDDCYSFFDRMGNVHDTLYTWAYDKGLNISERQKNGTGNNKTWHFAPRPYRFQR